MQAARNPLSLQPALILTGIGASFFTHFQILFFYLNGKATIYGSMITPRHPIFCLYPFAVEWYSSCRLGTVSLTINLSVLQPKNPRKRWCLPGVLPRREVGDPACTLPWGPKTDHPCSLPASADASDASDVIQRRPSQVTQD